MLSVFRALGHPVPLEMAPIVEAPEQPPVEAPEPIDEVEDPPLTSE